MPKEVATKDQLFSEFEAICRHYSALNKKKNTDAKAESLLDYFIDVAKNVSRKRYGQPEDIFELAKTDIYPERISDLAESFGMMIVKIEARELRLLKAIEELEKSNQALKREMDERKVLENNKNKELISKVMVMAERRERVLAAIDQLQNVRPSSLDDYVKQVHHTLHIIRQKFETSSEWNEFESYFLNIHEDFYNNLLKKYPDLTSRELRLCAFLKLKMNTKEIANLTNLSVKTIEVYRSQLRQKFGIFKNTNLSQFIANI
ncbi:LuxR C-terminal-related transcriptional regulator [bacterium]|nr:LuxR C-terminal-related transcriptional regulator [bacterium]MBU1634482.1 LuxR C-terminal-related transcriptional regulator [bacterium]MBU1874640.1 LuxR C-terminal-related transcriptional regulator [bacterium]